MSLLVGCWPHLWLIFPLDAYCFCPSFSFTQSPFIHPLNIVVYFSYHSVGGGFIIVQVAQGSRVSVPEGSDLSSSCVHISLWPQALNGEYNALLRYSIE